MAKTDPSFAELFARMKGATRAALAMRRCLVGSLALQREEARGQGLAKGCAEAQAEWAREFSTGGGGVLRRRARICPKTDHAAARSGTTGREANLQSIVEGAARDAALDRVVAAARSRDDDERWMCSDQGRTSLIDGALARSDAIRSSRLANSARMVPRAP